MTSDEQHNERLKNAEDKMVIISVPCWKCKKGMNICFIDAQFGMIYPYDFDEKDVKLAQENGVLLKHCYSSTAEESYLGNVCPHCSALCGNWHVFDDYWIEIRVGATYEWKAIDYKGNYSKFEMDEDE